LYLYTSVSHLYTSAQRHFWFDTSAPVPKCLSNYFRFRCRRTNWRDATLIYRRL